MYHVHGTEGFAWNNLGYLWDWKPTSMSLPAGEYAVDIDIGHQNGRSLSRAIYITVGQLVDGNAIHG